MKNAVIYVHGKDGSANEANHYKQFFNEDYEVIGFDYKSKFPWQAKEEFQKYFDFVVIKYNDILLIGNSIGAYFSMISLSGKQIKKAMFISPIVDMENVILNMMKWENVSEEELEDKKIINTSFGESLLWEYLSYVRKNSIIWDIPTNILYGEKDDITSLKAMNNFANKINADLTILENGEHWFHTEEQISFLDSWFEKSICSNAD